MNTLIPIEGRSRARSVWLATTGLASLILLIAPSALAYQTEAELCVERRIAAEAVSTQSDVQAFAECAAAYVAKHGTDEARRAFNEDKRWKHGSTYVFVQQVAKSGKEATTFVFPPDPSREDRLWGAAIDGFGTDLFYEVHRMLQSVDAGWTYYSIVNPQTKRSEPKASYLIAINWDGVPAVIGAGIYSRDWPGTCYEEEVSASALGSEPTKARLHEFVRCAGMLLETEGYFAKEALESDPRWSSGSNYVYVLDMAGNQVISGNHVRVNGKQLHEWGWGGRQSDQFLGRDKVAVGGAFGEAEIYYRASHPLSGTYGTKVGFLKRVVAHGVPLLVGSGYFVEPNEEISSHGCADNYASAEAVRTHSDLKAFVQCAAEYVQVHGEDEAYRAFINDRRWRMGETYLGVLNRAPSGDESISYVFPPDPSREGNFWGPLPDIFGDDYFQESNRILSLVDEGWIHYAFINPVKGLTEPKSSYAIGIEWKGDQARIGAGIYPRDLPGACDPGEVNARELETHPDPMRLQQFVRCAAWQVESAGHFAGPVLASSPRWKHGSIYVFGIDPQMGTVEFSGSRSSFAVSRRIPELLFDGRDLVAVGAQFGEAFWYYNFTNPATGRIQPKVAFVKLVYVQGTPLLVGAGYNP